MDKFVIKLGETDFLTYQLYAASKSERIKKKRRLSWITYTVLWFSFAFLFHLSGQYGIRNILLLVALFYLIFLPLRLREHYKNHYLNNIREHYKNRFGVESEIWFDNDFLFESDPYAFTKIKLSAIKQINEIPSHIFIKLKYGPVVIIPKSITDLNKFKQELQAIAGRLNIPWNVEPDWKWK